MNDEYLDASNCNASDGPTAEDIMTAVKLVKTYGIPPGQAFFINPSDFESLQTHFAPTPFEEFVTHNIKTYLMNGELQVPRHILSPPIDSTRQQAFAARRRQHRMSFGRPATGNTAGVVTALAIVAIVSLIVLFA